MQKVKTNKLKVKKRKRKFKHIDFLKGRIFENSSGKYAFASDMNPRKGLPEKFFFERNLLFLRNKSKASKKNFSGTKGSSGYDVCSTETKTLKPNTW